MGDTSGREGGEPWIIFITTAGSVEPSNAFLPVSSSTKMQPSALRATQCIICRLVPHRALNQLEGYCDPSS